MCHLKFNNIFLFKVSRLLLLAGADPDAVTDDASPLLCLSVKHCLNELAALLIEFGADPCKRDGHGASALTYAASVGNLDAVQMLHQKGAHVILALSLVLQSNT